MTQNHNINTVYNETACNIMHCECTKSKINAKNYEKTSTFKHIFLNLPIIKHANLKTIIPKTPTPAKPHTRHKTN